MDSIVGLDVVTVDGSIVHATRSNKPELYWVSHRNHRGRPKESKCQTQTSHGERSFYYEKSSCDRWD
jgi:hypothetical protein